MTDRWLHIAFAPKDGRRVRVKSDEGTTHIAVFRAPCWWVMGNGAARIGDDVLFKGDRELIMTAVQFQELPNG